MKRKFKDEEGSILMLVIIVMSIVMILGTGLMTMVANSHSQAVRTAESQQAYYAAKTVLDTVLDQLFKEGTDQQKMLNEMFNDEGKAISEVYIKDAKSGGQKGWKCTLTVEKKSLDSGVTEYLFTSTAADKELNPTISKTIKARVEGNENRSGEGAKGCTIELSKPIKVENSHTLVIDKLLGNKITLKAHEGLQINSIIAQGEVNLGSSGLINIGTINGKAINIITLGNVTASLIEGENLLNIHADNGINIKEIIKKGDPINLLSKADIEIGKITGTNKVTLNASEQIKIDEITNGGEGIVINEAKKVDINEVIASGNDITIESADREQLACDVNIKKIKGAGLKINVNNFSSNKIDAKDKAVVINTAEHMLINEIVANDITLKIGKGNLAPYSNNKIQIHDCWHFKIELEAENIAEVEDKIEVIKKNIDLENSRLLSRRCKVSYRLSDGTTGEIEVPLPTQGQIGQEISKENNGYLEDEKNLSPVTVNRVLIAAEVQGDVIRMKADNSSIYFEPCYRVDCPATNGVKCLLLTEEPTEWVEGAIDPVHILSNKAYKIEARYGRVYFGREATGIDFYPELTSVMEDINLSDEERRIKEAEREAKRVSFELYFLQHSPPRGCWFTKNKYISYLGYYPMPSFEESDLYGLNIIDSDSRGLQLGGSSKGEYAKFIRYEE